MKNDKELTLLINEKIGPFLLKTDELIALNQSNFENSQNEVRSLKYKLSYQWI